MKYVLARVAKDRAGIAGTEIMNHLRSALLNRNTDVSQISSDKVHEALVVVRGPHEEVALVATGPQSAADGRLWVEVVTFQSSRPWWLRLLRRSRAVREPNIEAVEDVIVSTLSSLVDFDSVETKSPQEMVGARFWTADGKITPAPSTR